MEVKLDLKQPSSLEEVGNAYPDYLDFSLSQILLAGDEELDLSPESPVAVRATTQDQIIFEKEIKEHRDFSFTKATLTFEKEFSMKSRYKVFNLEFSEPTLEEESDQKLEKNKSILLKIKFRILNILTRDDSAKTESYSFPEAALEISKE